MFTSLLLAHTGQELQLQVLPESRLLEHDCAQLREPQASCSVTLRGSCRRACIGTSGIKTLHVSVQRCAMRCR